jgi:hypothetical protein
MLDEHQMTPTYETLKCILLQQPCQMVEPLSLPCEVLVGEPNLSVYDTLRGSETMSARIEELCHTLRLSWVASCARELDPIPCTQQIESFLIHALETESELKINGSGVSDQ